MPDALEKLAAITLDVCRAAETGDYAAAEQAVGRRDAQIATLRAALPAAPLTSLQLQQLERILRRGSEAILALAARRETYRAEIAALEADRQRLARWSPLGPQNPQLDFSG